MSILNLYIYTSCWCNCVTGPVWTECVDCGEVRYIFPLGNIYIYIYIYITFGDQLATLIPGHPVRDRDAVVGIDPDTLPGRPTSQ